MQTCVGKYDEIRGWKTTSDFLFLIFKSIKTHFAQFMPKAIHDTLVSIHAIHSACLASATYGIFCRLKW